MPACAAAYAARYIARAAFGGFSIGIDVLFLGVSTGSVLENLKKSLLPNFVLTYMHSVANVGDDRT